MTNLARWTQRLGEQEMPILAYTAQEIALYTEREDSSSVEMAQIILRDSAMTARVLKLANSSYFNPAGHPMRTISRAVVVLGYDVVKSLCLSIALINSLLKDSPQEARVMQLMAQSFHAAMQARSLAVACRNRAPEEVYVAALLSHLGEMAFWCFGGDQAENLDAALRSGLDPAQAELKVLGFRLARLTENLNREWNLSALLSESTDNDRDVRVRQVRLGRELSQQAEQGWDHPGVKRVLGRMAKEAGLSLEQMSEIAYRSNEQAARSAQDYGAASLVRLIPQPDPSTPEAIEADEPESDVLHPDPLLQLQILREVAPLFEGRIDINLLFNMVLEGIHRGIGMDRTLLALVTPDRKRIRAKYTLGQGQHELMQSFHFPLEGSREDIFSLILERAEPLWFDPDTARRDLVGLITPAIGGALGETAFLAVPLVAQRRTIGLIYADRGPSQRALDEESFSSFKHFCQQANLGLSLVARG